MPDDANSKQFSAWLVFAKPERFQLSLRLSASDLPNVRQGDAFFFTDRETKIVTGVRRVYLIELRENEVVFYFDRSVNFDRPASLSNVQAELHAGSAWFQLIDKQTLQKIIDAVGCKDVPYLPELNKNDPECQKYVRNLLHKAFVDDLLGPAGGPEEEIVETSVLDRYLVGKLAPYDPKGEAAFDEPLFVGTEDEVDPNTNEPKHLEH